MTRQFSLAGIQMNVNLGQDNTPQMLERLNQVSRYFPWIDLVMFSECCWGGTEPATAQPLPNPSSDRFCQWAADTSTWLIPGSMFELASDGKVYNTALVISPEGNIVATYRKLFPWRPLERSTAGENFCVFDIPDKGRFGLCICYDQWFPEVIRSLTWLGAEAVFCPTATSTSDREQELVLAQAHAIVNQIYYFNLNGLENGGLGRSLFIDPEGRILQTSGEREMIMTEIIDLDQVSRVRKLGTLGLSRLWRDLENFRHIFPVYGAGIQDHP